MFNFFKKKTVCPVSEENRIWIEDSFLWLIKEFGINVIIDKQTLLPTPDFFPINFNNKQTLIEEVTKIVCNQMDIDFDKIHLCEYSDSIISTQSITGFPIYTEKHTDDFLTTGLFFDTDTKNDKFIVAVEKTCLSDTENLIATIAHELAHVKLLGEKKLDINDEYLTDIFTAFYGLGIANANASFKFYNHGDRFYNKQGYLTQQEWGYVLGIYSYIKNEQSMNYLNYLSSSVRKDFTDALKFIEDNKHIVLV